MSEHWIILIPEDPRFVPDTAKQIRARERLAEIAPTVAAVESKVYEKITFFDSGENAGGVRCPSCAAKIPHAWWRERMSEDYRSRFRLGVYPMPCCGARHTLHELRYEWPQGFGRFALTARNSDIGKLPERDRQELEAILDAPLRLIYRRL
jgi:hypothetical protein